LTNASLRDVFVLVTASVRDALLLENELIKQQKPDFNCSCFSVPILCLRGESVVYHVSRISDGLAQAGPGDTIHLLDGIYAEGIDDRSQVIRGGTSWSKKLTIGRCPARANSEVIIRPPAGAEFVLYLTKPSSSFIEFRGLTFDGSHVLHDALKFTNASYDPLAAGPHHVRVRDCVVKNAPGNGVLTTCSHYHQFIRSTFSGNGGCDRLRHGMYLSGHHNLVSECDFTLNAGGGCEVWDSSEPPQSNDNQIEYCRAWDNGQSAANGNETGGGNGFGIGGGSGNVVYRCVAFDNVIGIQVGMNSIGATLRENHSTGNTCPWPPAGSSADYYYDEGATNTLLIDNL
jgi:hypothetical protein